MVKSFELCKNSAAVCWTSARNSPWANKLPGREGLKLRAIGADLLETKLSSAQKAHPGCGRQGRKLSAQLNANIAAGSWRRQNTFARLRQTKKATDGMTAGNFAAQRERAAGNWSPARLRQGIPIGASDILGVACPAAEPHNAIFFLPHCKGQD